MNKLFFALFVLFQYQLATPATFDDRWTVAISQPTVWGWVTVLVYLAAVVRCITKSKESKFYGGNYQFWLYLAAFLFFLGINKQLVLHTWLIDLMRDRAQTYGWYEYKQSLLVVFASLFIFGILLTMLRFRLYLANSWRNYKIAWAGIILLFMLVLIQVLPSQYADFFIVQHAFGFNLAAIIEISALTLIILGSYFNKNNIISLTEAITLTIKDYVETSKEDSPVQCPQCGVQPLSKPKDGRVFKCRSCGFHYSVRIVSKY